MHNRIRKIRVDRGLSQAVLGEKCNTTKQQIFKLEKAQRRLTVEWLFRLAGALDCHWAELVEDVLMAENAREEALLRQFRRLKPTGQRTAQEMIDSLARAEQAPIEELPPSPPRRAAAGGGD